MKLILFLVIVLFSLSPAYAVDYLIVDNPSYLHILNRYEQNLSPAEYSNLPEYCPLRVVDDNVMLSDSYTTAMKVEFSGQEYYLTKDPEGNLRESFSSGMESRVSCLSRNGPIHPSHHCVLKQ